VETDARPVGAGAMLTEGVVALTALAAFAVIGTGNQPGDFVSGAVVLTSGMFGEGSIAFLRTFFGIYMVFMAVTILTILGRYWRVVSAEIFGGTRAAFLGHKYVAAVTGWVLPIAFVLTGSWANIWLYFGGTNQLLAGFALTLVGIYLITRRQHHWYSLVPGLFMMVTTLAAIAVQAYIFTSVVLAAGTVDPTLPFRAPGPNNDLVEAGAVLGQQEPLWRLGGLAATTAVNLFSVGVGVAMFLLGTALFVSLLGSLSKARHAARAGAAAANGGTPEDSPKKP
jgi:carbon starvation protein